MQKFTNEITRCYLLYVIVKANVSSLSAVGSYNKSTPASISNPKFRTFSRVVSERRELRNKNLFFTELFKPKRNLEGKMTASPTPRTAKPKIATPQQKKINPMTIVSLILGVVVAVLNAIELFLLKRLPRKMKIYELLIFSMSISDLLFGVASFFMYAYQLVVPDSEDDDSTKSIWTTQYFMFIVSSILHLLTIAADRLFAVVCPVKHNIVVRRKRAIKTILVVWTISIVLTSALYLSNNFSKVFKETEITYEEEFSNSTDISASNSTDHLLNNTMILNEPIITTPDYVMMTSPPITIQPYPRGIQTTFKINPQPKQPPRIKLIHYIDKYKVIMEKWLAYVIVVADTALLVIYGLIIAAIFNHHRNTHKHRSVKTSNVKRVFLVCICIALAFVLFTLPFSIQNFMFDGNQDLTSSLLVVNSGINSIVFFIRGERK